MYIPLEFDFSWLISLLPFIFGFQRGKGAQAPTSATTGAGIPSQISGFTAAFPPGQQAAEFGRRIQSLISAGDYAGAAALETPFENLVTQLTPKNRAEAAELDQVRNQVRSLLAPAKSILSQQTAATSGFPGVQDEATKALLQALQPSPLDIEIRELSLQQLRKERARADQPVAPVEARVFPEIADPLYQNIAGRVEANYKTAADKITADMIDRGISIGSGIHQQILSELEKSKQQELNQAQQFASSRSAELGLQASDVDLRRQQIERGATEFNIGIGPELEERKSQRALESVSRLGALRESGLDRALRGGLETRRQDIDLFGITQEAQAQERARKQNLLASIFSPLGSIAGTVGGVAGVSLLPQGRLNKLSSLFGGNTVGPNFSNIVSGGRPLTKGFSLVRR